jgi:hypothetical protein
MRLRYAYGYGYGGRRWRFKIDGGSGCSGGGDGLGEGWGLVGVQQTSVGLVTGLRPEPRGDVGLRVAILVNSGCGGACRALLVKSGGDDCDVAAEGRAVVVGSMPIEFSYGCTGRSKGRP